MTTVSQILGSAAVGGGPFLTSPKDFLRYSTRYINLLDGGTQKYTAEEANFFATIAKAGVQSATSFTANTWKTIVDVSGEGFLFNTISPAVTGGSQTLSTRITVDGEPYEFSVSPTGVSMRQVVGMLDAFNSSGTGGSSNNDPDNRFAGFNYGSGGGVAGVSAGHLLFPTGSDLHIPSLVSMLKANQVLKFLSSLKVEMRVDSNISDATARMCGVMYKLN